MVKMVKTEKMDITVNVAQKANLVNLVKMVAGVTMAIKVLLDVPVWTVKTVNQVNLVHLE